MSGILLCALCVAGLLNVGFTAEEDQHTVNVTFYMMSSSQWESNEETVRESVAQQTSQYCKNNISACGLVQWEDTYAFNPGEVAIKKLYPDKNYMSVLFYVKFNPEIPDEKRNVTKVVLQREAVQGVFTVREYRDKINNVAGATIVRVNGAKYSPPPNHQINIIIIPISCGILLILLIVTIALHYWNKAKVKLQQREERLRNKGKRKGPHAQARAVELKPSPNRSSPSSKVGPEPRFGNQPQTQHDLEAGDGNYNVKSASDAYYGNNYNSSDGPRLDVRHDNPRVIDSQRQEDSSHKPRKHKKHRKEKKHRHSTSSHDADNLRFNNEEIDLGEKSYNIPVTVRTSLPGPVVKHVSEQPRTQEGGPHTHADRPPHGRHEPHSDQGDTSFRIPSDENTDM